MQLFNSLSIDKQIEFFVNCQKLLIKYHPNSSFVIRANNLQKSIDSFINQVNHYKGYFYMDENICVLFNYIFIDENKGLTDNEILRKMRIKNQLRITTVSV